MPKRFYDISKYNSRDDATGGLNPNDEFYTPAYAINPLTKYLKRRSII